MEPLKDLEKSGLLDKLPPGVKPYTLFDNVVRPLSVTPEEAAVLAKVMRKLLVSGVSALSGYPYLGQFLAHDISRLREGGHDLGVAALACDQLLSTVTSRLDLSNVYESAEPESPMRQAGTAYMNVGYARKDSGELIHNYDLPRLSGKAIIADERDDENLILSQLHLQFLKLHNFLVDELGKKHPDLSVPELFDVVKKETVLHYQDVILHDFLYEVMNPFVWNAVIYHRKSIIWKPDPDEAAVLPIEYAGAVGRFGHSMVREDYRLNRSAKASIDDIFELTGQGSLNGRHSGSECIPATHIIDWLLYLDFPSYTLRARRPPEPNRSSRISPHVNIQLRNTESLPCGGGTELSSRNIIRSSQLGVGSGQAMVRYILSKHKHELDTHGIKLTQLTHEQIEAGRRGLLKNCPRLLNETPLWYYILAEAYSQEPYDNVGKLGVLGSLILAESIMGLLRLDKDSLIYQTRSQDLIVPTKKIGGISKRFIQMSDLILAADKTLPDPTEF